MSVRYGLFVIKSTQAPAFSYYITKRSLLSVSFIGLLWAYSGFTLVHSSYPGENPE